MQYLNRTAAAVGASLYFYGDANENSHYKKIGGITTATCLYVDLLASAYKERHFRPEERKKEWTELIKDTERLACSYQELAEILKPIPDDSSLGEFNNLLKSLKSQGDELLTKGEERGTCSDSSELILLNDDRIREVCFIKKDGGPFTQWVKQWVGRMFISLRDGNELWENWSKMWEGRRSKQEKIKSLMEILQEAISKCRQGVDDDKIEKEIRGRMLKLEVIEIDDKDKEDIYEAIEISEEQKEDNNNTLATGISSWLPNSFRKRTNSNSQENKSLQLETQIEVPPKKN